MLAGYLGKRHASKHTPRRPKRCSSANTELTHSHWTQLIGHDTKHLIRAPYASRALCLISALDKPPENHAPHSRAWRTSACYATFGSVGAEAAATVLVGVVAGADCATGGGADTSASSGRGGIVALTVGSWLEAVAAADASA